MAKERANLLILGESSTLAQCFNTLYKNHCTLIPHNKCDIRDSKQIEHILKNNPHKYVINCMAITDMSYCQDNTIDCFNVNIAGPYFLNQLCKKYNKKLIHISSNYAINPPNTYGWSKKLSEEVIDKEFLVVRGNFYGMKQYIINNIVRNNKVKAFENVFFSPVSINRFATEIYSNKDKKSILNVFTDTSISYYDFAIKVAETFFKDKNKLVKRQIYTKDLLSMPLAFDSSHHSDIRISIDDDLKSFKKYLESTPDY